MAHDKILYTQFECPSCGGVIDADENPPEMVHLSWEAEDSEGRTTTPSFSGYRCPHCEALLSER